jgi:endonuclease YncB( thermonuclease family)
MRQVLKFVVLAAVLLVASAYAETIAGKVVSVSDGDTVTVLQEKTEIKIRLHGIDSPEKNQDFGQAARKLTADLCFGEVVTVHVTDTDRYGRKVGLVLLEDGRVLNHELVAAGLAHWYAQYAPDDLALERLQADAKAAKRGLWSRPDVITPYEFRKGKRSGNGVPYNPPGSEVEPSGSAGLTDAVYITESGTKYHKAGCRFLAQSKRAISRAAAAKRFEPCGVCRP